MFGFGCKTCKVLKEENAYLRRFIDSLLVRLNMPRADAPAEPFDIEEALKEDQAIKDGKISFGD